MEFEIIDVVQELRRILVTIEITKTRERRQFGYPMFEGWDTEIEGEPRFLRDIRDKLKKEEEKSKVKLDLKKFDKLKGKKFK